MAKLSVKDLRKLVLGRSVSAGKESLSLEVGLPEDKKELEGLRDEIETILTDGAEEASNPGDDEELEDEDLEEEDVEEDEEDIDENDPDAEDEEDDDDDYEFEDA